MKQQSNPAAVIQDGAYSSIAEEEAKDSISLVDKVSTTYAPSTSTPDDASHSHPARSSTLPYRAQDPNAVSNPLLSV